MLLEGLCWCLSAGGNGEAALCCRAPSFVHHSSLLQTFAGWKGEGSGGERGLGGGTRALHWGWVCTSQLTPAPHPVPLSVQVTDSIAVCGGQKLMHDMSKGSVFLSETQKMSNCLFFFLFLSNNSSFSVLKIRHREGERTKNEEKNCKVPIGASQRAPRGNVSFSGEEKKPFCMGCE